jgi:hypothetical protein
MMAFYLIGKFWGMWGVIAELKARYSYRELRSNGVLIDGEVLKARYVEQHGRYTSYCLSVTAEFETPDGRMLTREFKGDIEMFASKVVPLPETPVVLLYANDIAVIML